MYIGLLYLIIGDSDLIWYSKYTSSNEINSIILGDSIAGVVYKDKVEIIQF